MQLNESQYNSGLYGIDGQVAPGYSSDLAVFGGFSFSDMTTYIVSEMPISGPSRDIIGGDIPRGHGQFISGDFFRRTEVLFDGYVKADTAEGLKLAMDELKKALRRKEQALDITEAGTVRRYVATCTNLDDIYSGRRGNQITVCPFRLRFECRTPFATARETTSTTLTITSSPTNLTVYQAGTAEAEPVVSLVFDSASTVTTVNVKRLDPDGSTLEEIEYSGAIAAADVLAFDSENMQVRLNGASQRFTGAFLTLEPGSNLLQVSIDGTFSSLVTVSHKPAYL